MGDAPALPSHTPTHRLVATDDDLVAATLVPEDEAEYDLATEASADRISRYSPVVPGDFRARLARQGESRRTVLVRLRDPAAAAAALRDAGRCSDGPGRDAAGEPLHPVVARIDVNNTVRGRFQSAALGYDAMDPWAGTGWFTRALALVVDLAFTPVAPDPGPGGGPTGGFGLHRVEANVQSDNAPSLRVLENVGFRREGLVERMLYVPGPDGREAWRDHVVHGLTAEEWTPPGR
ncbi:GNAT family N-acetyltransferase [Kytococcus sp. Marseille-QA3725]